MNKEEKLIYEKILQMEELYENTSTECIKENLLKIKQKKNIEYKDHCKRIGEKVGIYRLFEPLEISLSKEKHLTNPAHPSSIKFTDLIKICNYLYISMEEITKPIVERKKNPVYMKEKWTEELIKEFLDDYENGVEPSILMNKYKISLGSVSRYYQLFKDNKTTHRKIRK